MGMNAGIVVLQDGSPCVVCDSALPGEVTLIEVSRADHQVTIICTVAPPVEPDDPFKAARRTGIQKLSKIARLKSPSQERLKLDYPLDSSFYNFLKKKEVVAIGTVNGKEVTTLKIVPVVFTDT